MIAVAAVAIVLYVGLLSWRRSTFQGHAEYHAMQRYFASSELLHLYGLWRVPRPGYCEKLSKAEADVRRQGKLVEHYTYAAEHPWLPVRASQAPCQGAEFRPRPAGSNQTSSTKL